jgi:serine/threonine protein kinase
MNVTPPCIIINQKYEREGSRTLSKLLKNETVIITYLQNKGVKHIPIVFWYGLYKDDLWLVMTLYECSLYEYLQQKELSLSTIHSIMIQCITIIENIHKNYVLHRDIKPQNIMIKRGEIFFIDFGFSTFYLNSEGNHLPLREDHETMIGTPKYASIFIHDGCTPSRRDDLISLGYLYFFLLERELPWDTWKSSENPDPYEENHCMHYKNIQRKSMKSWDYLLSLSKEKEKEIILWNYLEYCYSLNYDQEPHYDAIKQLFIKKTI